MPTPTEEREMLTNEYNMLAAKYNVLSQKERQWACNIPFIQRLVELRLILKPQRR